MCRAYGRFRINTNLNIANGAALDCGVTNPGPANNGDTAWATGSALLLSGSNTTITTSGSGSIQNCVVLPYGMTFPQASSSNWGTNVALTIGGANGSAGNFMVRNVLAVGFGGCLSSSGNDRGTIENFYCDGVSGEYINNSFDTWSVRNLHNWPYATVGYNNSSPPASALTRSGVGVTLAGRNDDTNVEALDFGHATGMSITAIGNVYVPKFWSDNNASIGVSVSGGFDNVHLGMVWAFSDGTGLVVNGGSPNNRVHVDELQVNVTAADCVDVSQGTLFVGHADISGCTNWGLLTPNGPAGIVDARQINFHDLSTSVNDPCPVGVGSNSTTATMRLKSVSYDQSRGSCVYGASQLRFPTAASAAAVALPVNADQVEVTGTTTVSTLTPGWGGRIVSLFFDGAVTVQNGTGGGQVALAGGANFTSAAGSVLTLAWNPLNANWREIGRTQ